MIVAVTILVIAIKENRLSEEVQKLEGKTIDENPIENIDDKQEMPKSKKAYIFFLHLYFYGLLLITPLYCIFSICHKVWGMEGGSFANALMIATGAAIFKLYTNWNNFK